MESRNFLAMEKFTFAGDSFEGRVADLSHRIWSGITAVIVAVLVATAAKAEFGGRPGYAGSDKCKECHEEVYKQWRLTPHSRMLVNAQKDPSAIKANNFNEDIPFTPADIAYTVGSHWVQKYLTRIDGQLYVLPKYWNIPKRDWEPYSIFDWRQKPYQIHCDGCHTVGFDSKTKTFFEPGVGCESCHGPGKRHVEGGGDPKDIVNPAKLDPDKSLMVCMQCHTDGQDTLTNTYPFPVNFVPGEDLTKYFSDFFMPKPKSKQWYWGTMDFFERKRMYYFFQSKFYSTNRACEVCGFDRGVSNKKERYMSPSEYCGTCHKIRYEEFKAHSGHSPDTTECIDCHNPTMASDKGGGYSIHDHKFDFSQAKLACSACHDPSDKNDKAVKAIAPDNTVTWAPEPEHHDFHFTRPKFGRKMSRVESCLHCHKEKDAKWVEDKVKTMIDISGKLD